MTSVADKLAQKSSKKTASKQVRLRLVHIDFWSVVKFSFLLSICFGIITIVATFLMWTVIENTGVLGSVNNLLNDVSGSAGVGVDDFVTLPQLMLFSLVVALLNLVAGTALGAVAAFLYNLAVKVTGGLVFGFTNS
ncbi:MULTISPECIES: DUF3566 domain-containing protein [Pseudoclavibacter]|jgi:hypothetical protein|uniref:DUF3566 domain-containing protein n=1 Tax=Pseudoclavibacter terrae TaxID=1530195 RepID=A0A7J5B1T9_9MICO|nr:MULTISPECIES: DUF3566 domain-containing protein [Pseudoclavibacter]KAB1637709.1 DUF3566 domain-containing protein [Pseudoclavibacter terrae]MBS3179085.1 DUF3566 domain-containing protein [Pseudoclavibacter sp. Marseille-Q4354]NYF11890.1 putative membrane protein [Pseudoclavibacter sp. JAI123]PPG32166.1 hypothetical protein C5B97_03640 [Pseudoclavibacter sp. RFBB5]PPG38201.1 hypothetical protein C5C17_16305 [Pseudoclavibacter sp. RFBA6]